MGEVASTEVDLENGGDDNVPFEYRYDTDDPVADVQHDGHGSTCRTVGQDALCADMESFGAKFLEHNLVIKETIESCEQHYKRDLK